MKISLKNYTLRYLTIAFLLIMGLWASLFYAYILDEVYDNIDDGLKNSKDEIIKAVFQNPELLTVNEFGIGQFRIRKSDNEISLKNKVSNEFFYMPFDDEEEPYRVLKTGFQDKNGISYSLEIRTSTVEEDDLLFNLATALLVLYLVLVLSMFIINSLIIRKTWKPFQIIIENLDNYRLGNRKTPEQIVTNVSEFNRLDKSIRQMWLRNEEIFDEQKIFIENASHELQTPLAITINKLDLMLEDETLTEKLLQQIAAIKAALIRMVNLNKSLLMLSRIENKQYKMVDMVCFNHIANKLIDDFEEFWTSKTISVELHADELFETRMNKELANILISNLLRNAIKYNKHHGSIDIYIDKKQFIIKNSGKNVPLNKNTIFNRFYKEEQDSSSTGLGLAIANSIVTLYDTLKIDYFFEEGKHCFRIALISE